MINEATINTLPIDTEKKLLPNGWKWLKLGEICEIKGGKRLPAGSDFAKNPTPFPYIRVTDFHNGTIKIEQLKFLEPSIQKQIERYTIRKDDVYISIAGTIGIVGVIPSELDGANLTENAARLVIKDKTTLFRDYLALYLHSLQGQNAIKARTNTVGQPKLGLERIATIKIPLPPLPEQKRIAAILAEQLAAVEQARKAAQEQLEAAKALTTAYLREVFESEEAKGWERKKLDKIAETCSGSTPSRSNPSYYQGNIPWVKTGELKDSSISDTEEHINEIALKESSVKMLPKGTLLVAMYGQGQTRGRTGLLLNPSTTNQACFAILPNYTKFIPEFLQFWFRHNYLRLRRETEGRGGNQPNLNGAVLNSQQITLPTIPKQEQIVKLLEEKTQISQHIMNDLSYQLETINQLPAALLRCAFNGKL